MVTICTGHLKPKKNTRLQKQTYTQRKCPENALQCQPWTFVQLIVNQRQRKREKAATLVLVCTGHLKLLANDHSDFALVYFKKHYIALGLCNLGFSSVEFLANCNCTKSKGLNYSYNLIKLCN